MRYTERMPTVEAVEFTKEIATAAERMVEAKFPAAEKQKFRDFDEFFTDTRDDVDGTWLSVIDVHEGAEYGKYGVYCAREGIWKPLHVGDYGVQYSQDQTFDVLSADEFDARYDADKTPAKTPAKS